MAISMQCASCGQVYRLKESLAGRLLQCRQCGATMQAPALDPSFAPPAYQAETIYSAEPVLEPLAQGYSFEPPYAASSAGYGGSYSANPLGAAPKARRRKSNNSAIVWMAAGGGLLLGMALIVLIIVISGTGREGWITLLMAPGRERSKIRPITAPAEDPVVRFVQQAPAPAPTPPPGGPSPEPVLQQLVAAGHRLRNALAAIHDESSARRQEPEVVAAVREFGDVAIKLKDDFSTIPRDEDQRLSAIYEPQVKSISEQLKREFERVGRIPGAGWVIANGVRFEAIRVQFALARPVRRPPRNDLRRLQGVLTAPMPTPTNADNFAQFPEREVVEIVVRGLPADGHEFVAERIKAISNCRAYMHHGVNNSVRVTIAPVSDVRQLAAKIDFGKVVVLHASQSLLVVEADASKFPPPLPREVVFPSDPEFYRRNLDDLSSRDLDRRRSAAARLANAEPKELKAEIARALMTKIKDPDRDLRIHSVKGLPVWGTGEQVLPLLIEGLRDSDDSVVHHAIQGLGNLKDVRAVGPLCEKATRHGFQVHDALRKIGPVAEPELIKYLNHAEEEVSIVAVKALADVGTGQCLPFLKRVSQRNDSMRGIAEWAMKAVQARISRNGA